MPNAARYLPLLALAAIALAAWRLGAGDFLSLEGLERHRGALQTAVAAHPYVSLAIYVAVFGIVTAACVPVALILTLSSGFLFGPLLGGAATVIGATIGAMIAYFAARSALGAGLWRRAKRSDGTLQRLAAGFGQDAFSYVLTARLIPLFPFWLVNVAAGLAAAPVGPYVAATALGAIPTSLIYAGIGHGLRRTFAEGEEPRLASLADPQLLLPLLGLAALALAPIVVRRLRARATPQA